MGLVRPPRTARFIAGWLVIALLCSFAHGKVIYVDGDAPGGSDGTSWANAYVYLQDALADANQAAKPLEIRVAQGAYPPDRGKGHVPGDRTETFHLLNGVALKGGYAGLAGNDPNARDIDQYATILTGDLGADRSYHVVTGDATDETAILDGFVIADGNGARSGRGGAGSVSMGAGMTNDAGSPTVTRCTFRHNSASLGAGMYSDNGSCPTLTACVFIANDGDGMHNADGSCPTLAQCTFTENEGCGMKNDASSPTLIDCLVTENAGSGIIDTAGSNPTLTRCTFSANVADEGGGLINDDSSPTLTECVFRGNSAGRGGGMMNDNGSDPLLIECVFSENAAIDGGGMVNTANSNPTLTRCTFSENLAESSGGGMANHAGSEPDLVECSFIGNVAYSGGAIYCVGSGMGRGGPYPPGHLAATRCLFADNLAHEYGGALGGGSDCSIAVADCTFTGNVSYGDGGGIYGDGCKATLIECELAHNTARVSGGGIYGNGCTATLIECELTHNTARGSGGGIYHDGVGPFYRLALIRSRFCGNRAGTDGGGLSVISDTRLEATHCLFAGNVAGNFGGAIYGASWSEQSLTNCTLAQNVATRGSALHHSEANWIHLANCILWDNVGDMADYTGMPLNYYKYCDAQDLNAYGPGHIHADPLFARSGYWVSRDDPNTVVPPTDPNVLWVNGDYHLKSQAGRWDPNSGGWVIDDVTSPCVDAGDPSNPVASEHYPNGGIINMGFYGGTPEAGKSPSGQSAKYGGGTGHPDDPFLIYTAEQMNTIGATRSDWDKDFRLMADIDLATCVESGCNAIGSYGGGRGSAVLTPFTGTFDGGGHTISGFVCDEPAYAGLFRCVDDPNAEVRNLGLIDPRIDAGNIAGALVGLLKQGTVTNCYVEGGSVRGNVCTGGLVGANDQSTITGCGSTAAVTGIKDTGGLIGLNDLFGHVMNCYAAGHVTGRENTGGLVGRNYIANITTSCATGRVDGELWTGGFIGYNDQSLIDNCYSTATVTGGIATGGFAGSSNFHIAMCYSTGGVAGSHSTGGFVGDNAGATFDTSFWDVETSGLADSDGGEGRTTVEMQTADTFLAAGWDLAGETTNGTRDLWWILEDQDYPRLWWEPMPGD